MSKSPLIWIKHKLLHYNTDKTQGPSAKFNQNLYTEGVSNLIWQTATAINESWFVGRTCINQSKSYTEPFKLLYNLYSTHTA